MNTIREIERINEEELQRGIAGTSSSWHTKYNDSAWIYIGNLDHSLTEGDIIAVLSQYGEIEDLHLVRDDDTGKSKGFAFCKYEDCRSCILAVDNFIGIRLCGRPMRIDHVQQYRLPKHLQQKEEEEEDKNNNTNHNNHSHNNHNNQSSSLPYVGPGHAYQGQQLANNYSIQHGQDLFAKPQSQQQQQQHPPTTQQRSSCSTTIPEQQQQTNRNQEEEEEENKQQQQKKKQRKQKERKKEQRRKKEKEKKERKEKNRRKRRRSEEHSSDEGKKPSKEFRNLEQS